MPPISPKVLYTVGLSVAAAVALWLITGDDSFLVAILLSLAGGGAGVAASPAPGVKQAEVDAVALGKAEIVPVSEVEARAHRRTGEPPPRSG